MSFQGDSIYWVEVEKIVPNPFQPRREFDIERLQELADSIRMYGVLQPLTVTRNEVQREDGTFYSEYELIAGERRLRASKLAGVSQVPVIIREGEQSEQEKLELAIIENLQREDLNAVDRALAFRQLADVFGLQHTQVAKKVGRSREYVSNTIRLLNLPDYILSALRQADINEGHARTLLMLNDRPEEQDVVFREILLKKLSVREVERIARNIATDKVRQKTLEAMDATLIEMEKQFTETLGTRVHIQKTDFGGKLTIDYFSVEDLESILERMKDEAAVVRLADSAAHAAALVSAHTPLQVSETPEVIESETVMTSSVTDAESPRVAVSGPQSVSTLAHQLPEVAQSVVSTPVAPVVEPEVAVPVQAPATPEVAAAPVTEVSPSPVRTASISPSPLAVALSRALGRPLVPVSDRAVVPTPAPMLAATPIAATPVAPVIAPVPKPAVEEKVIPSVSVPPVKDEDDGDMYSIKNFSI